MQKKQQKKEEKLKEGQKKVTSIFGGPWKRAGSSSTIFGQKIGFFKILKNPYFIAFPEKWVATFFFKKAMLQGGQT